MAFAFLLLLSSSKAILGEDIVTTEIFKDGVKMGEVDKAGELDMGVLDNRTKVNVLNTLKKMGKVEDLVDVMDKEWKEMNELKETKALGKPREKRASFYKSGSELAYQVLTRKCLFHASHLVGF